MISNVFKDFVRTRQMCKSIIFTEFSGNTFRLRPKKRSDEELVNAPCFGDGLLFVILVCGPCSSKNSARRRSRATKSNSVPRREASSVAWSLRRSTGQIAKGLLSDSSRWFEPKSMATNISSPKC